MRRAVGLGVGAVVLSVTVGVMVGLVIHTGMTQRAGRATDSTAQDPPTTGSGVTTGSEPLLDVPNGDHGLIQVDPSSPSRPWALSLTPVTGTRSTGTAAPSATGTVAPRQRTTRTAHTPTSNDKTGKVGHNKTTKTKAKTKSRRSRSPRPRIIRTTHTPSPTITSSTRGSTKTPRTTTVTSTPRRHTTSATATTSTAPSTTTTSGTVTTTGSVAPRPGHDRPDRPCGTLGEKSATARRTTLYCQHDLTDGSLRWRAVTNGGGCLNQTMTGVGTDGRRYACRRDTNGLNYWRPAR